MDSIVYCQLQLFSVDDIIIPNSQGKRLSCGDVRHSTQPGRGGDGMWTQVHALTLTPTFPPIFL